MSYGRIRRGPMAADAFTQIRNTVFRDPRLTAKAMGIFGNISTHRDGWGITPESIATQMRDGVSAIKAGLRELEKHGYLQRERERRPDGTLGGSEYFITDQPETIAMSNRRSEPEVDFPPVDEPPVDQPPVDDHLHKKTNSKKPKSKKTLSPPASPKPQPTPPAPPEDEREIATAPDNDGATAEAAAMLAGLPARLGKTTVTTLAPLAAAAFTHGWTAETLRAELDRRIHLPSIRNKGALPGLYERTLRDLPPATPAQSAGGRERCPDHPARYRRSCVDCVMAVPA